MSKGKKVDLKRIEEGVRLILEGIGEDPERPGIKRTPIRVAHMFEEILGGTHEDAGKYLQPIEGEKHDEMVLIKNRLTKEIADLIDTTLNPLGVMVVIEAEHMCMSMRGAKKPKSLTVTSAVRGSFRTSNATRFEAMTLIVGGVSGGRER
jgi:GTP cyclohydrolase I